MPIASLEDVEIAYIDEGEGEPVLLIHGFASTKEANWVQTGWIELLAASGFRVIAHDNRGHGASTKFYDAKRYSPDQMADDTLALMDHLGIEQAHVIGYSMGARIATRLALEQGRRCGKIILAGKGYEGMIFGPGDWWPRVIEGLLAPKLKDVSCQRARRFRAFAEMNKSDLLALSECAKSIAEAIMPEDFCAITNQTLVVVGTGDDTAGCGAKLARLIPDASYLPVPDRDHMRTVGDKVFMQGALQFMSD